MRDVPGGVNLRVRVQPRAARDAVAGQRGVALLVRVCAPASEGAANAALVRVLAQALDVAPSHVTLLRGGSSREKILHIAGTDARSVRALLS